MGRTDALSPEEAGRALRTHPGYPVQRKIESVRTMLELFRRALADLSAAIAEFPELGGPNGRISREKLGKDISIRLNKELFAALGTAKTLVDYSRRLKNLVDAALFDSKLKDAFHLGEHALIMGLRNSVLHQVHSRANWQKIWAGGAKTTHFVIQREDLLAEGELGTKISVLATAEIARTFLGQRRRVRKLGARKIGNTDRFVRAYATLAPVMPIS
jgi:hypothetical protein